jgi:hypothetical protein
MKPLPPVSAAPIFAHERTALYLRVRELHGFAAELETTAGTSRYYAALVHIGLLAMFSTASAGVAPTERTRARHLAKLRDQLARYAVTLRSMADRGLLEDPLAAFGNALVRDAETLIHDFSEALLQVESRSGASDSPAETAAGPADKLPFQDASATAMRSSQTAPRGARRIRHVDVALPTPRPSDARANGPKADVGSVVPISVSAHNDERSIDDAIPARALNKTMTSSPRAS